MKRLFAVLVCTMLVVEAAGGPAEPRPESSERSGGTSRSGPVELQRCHIKLIDHATLASDRNGILAFVDPDEMDEVREGQIVARLKDEIAAAALATAEKQATNDIEVRYAVKAAELAHVEHEKAVQANERRSGLQVVPDIEVRRLKLAAERSDLQIEQAEHQLELNRLARDEARTNLDAHRVEAPFDGIVTRVYKKKGEAVRQGDPILELVNTDRVRVEGQAEIVDAWDIKPGDRVEVRLEELPARPNRRPEVQQLFSARPEVQQVFEGRIVFVDVTAESTSGRVRVWAEVANRDNILVAGLTARMTIYPERP
jgi:RND family efflux transporter MFP subunit